MYFHNIVQHKPTGRLVYRHERHTCPFLRLPVGSELQFTGNVFVDQRLIVRPQRLNIRQRFAFGVQIVSAAKYN